MTETEKKALALVNEVNGTDHRTLDATYIFQLQAALCRAIERIEELEATERDCTERNYAKPLMELQAEYEAFRREVSDAVEEAIDAIFAASAKQRASDVLSRFIMPKPDPLQDALDATGWAHDVKQTGMADQLRAALAARGLKIVEAE